MTKQEKKNWIIDYLQKHGYVDIFIEEFVNLYIKECNPKKIEQKVYGSQYVPELSRYLTELYKENVLQRYTIGLNYSNDGFPKWCYCYELNKQL